MLSNSVPIVHTTSQKSEPSELTFSKGITLQDYMKNLESQNLDQANNQQSSEEEDLYAGMQASDQKNQPKMITFAINQIDQDEYRDESTVLGGQSRKRFREDEAIDDLDFEEEQKASINLTKNSDNSPKNQLASTNSTKSKTLKNSFNQANKFRIKNISISPKKPVSPKREMFRSLYGKSFGGSLTRPSQPSILSSTIHNKFFKESSVVKQPHNKKQLEFKEKNKKHYNEVIKYQNVIRNKHFGKLDLLNIRIDGVKDRLYQRRPYQRV